MVSTAYWFYADRLGRNLKLPYSAIPEQAKMKGTQVAGLVLQHSRVNCQIPLCFLQLGDFEFPTLVDLILATCGIVVYHPVK